MCGGQVVSVCIDPNDGGATRIMGLMRNHPRVPTDPYALSTFGQLFWSTSAVATLGAGYVGSSMVGWLFVVSRFAETNADSTSFVLVSGCSLIARGGC
jgi:hypothetical protein